MPYPIIRYIGTKTKLFCLDLKYLLCTLREKKQVTIFESLFFLHSFPLTLPQC